MLKYIIMLLASAITTANAQNCNLLAENYTDIVQEHLNYLASETLEGRKPGTNGHKLATVYIDATFKKLQLSPLFYGSFQQEFVIPNNVTLDSANTYLKIKKEGLELGLGYYPTKYSGNGTVKGKTLYVGYGIESTAPARDDIDDDKIKGAIAVMEIGSPDGIHPHSAYKTYHDLYGRIKLLEDKGAKAVILIDIISKVKNPAMSFKTLTKTGLPVVFIEDRDVAKKLIRKQKVSIQINLVENTHTVANVAGFIDNGQQNTVVIGAHYDHLGRSKENSRYTGDDNPVHFGADDNASGTAALLGLAQFLKTTEEPTLKTQNYMLVAFTAEEMGLLGSKHFADHLPEGHNYAYMLNMDMIGRLSKEYTLQINGSGTSPFWEEAFQNLKCELNLAFSPSGVGPSDHTSFYYKDIPALHFFTGTHVDYHKPGDVAKKINNEGITKVMNLMLALLAQSGGKEIEFTPTKNESTKAPKFSVTLGVMPNYMFNGGGLKLDGVTANKAAAKAGLEEGDVITKLGAYTISDIQTYMQALSTYKAGQEAPIEYIRAGEKRTTTVFF